MTEQLIFNIYKFQKDNDPRVYIGSTRNKLSHRLTTHKCTSKKAPTKFHNYVLQNGGFDNFKMTLIKTITVSSSKEAREQERLELEKYEKQYWLNDILPYSENHDKTRDIEKKRANRRAYYARKKENPEWMEKERERNKLKMRERRKKLKEEKLKK